MRKWTAPLVWLVCSALGCGGNPRDDEKPRAEPTVTLPGDQPILGQMGFAVTPAADVTGSLSATFTAPVTSELIPSETPGSATVTVDGVTRSLDSQTIVGAYAGSDLTYVVLFNETAPDFYVVIAAHAADLVDGAVLVLDGEVATAILVDETAGSGQLSQGGTLTIVASNLAPGGTLEASLTTDLVDVTLDAWPENLLPLTSDGQPAERAAVNASGAFSANYTTSRPENPTGTSSVSVDIAGLGAFSTTDAIAFPVDDAQPLTAIMLGAGGRGVVVVVPTDALVEGADIALGSLQAGAWIFLEDGTQVAAASGTLHVDSASLVEGGTISGSVTLSGDGYVFRCGEGECGEPSDEPVTECSTDVTDLATFVPTDAALENLDGAVPPPFGQVLWFTDAQQTTGIAVLLRTDEVLDDGVDIALDPVDVGGRPYPAGIFFAGACESGLDVQSGQLHLDPVAADATRITGTLSVVVEGTAAAFTLDVALHHVESGVPGAQ